jgi:hypothetical protein
MKDNKKVPDSVILMASREYLLRKARRSHPKGKFNHTSGTFFLSKDEICECCTGIRKPSRNFPHSENNHGRTAKHVASLFGVDRNEMLNKVKELKEVA